MASVFSHYALAAPAYRPRRVAVPRQRVFFGRDGRGLTLSAQLAMWWLGATGEQREVNHLRDGQFLRDEVSRQMLTGLATDNDETQQMVAAVNQPGDVVISAKLIASTVVALRMKLGISATDRNVPGNVEVVRREIVRVLRGYGVRNRDASAHLRLIEVAFFKEDSDRLVENARERACKKSRLVRWLLGDEPVGYDW